MRQCSQRNPEYVLNRKAKLVRVEGHMGVRAPSKKLGSEPITGPVDVSHATLVVQRLVVQRQREGPQVHCQGTILPDLIRNGLLLLAVAPTEALFRNCERGLLEESESGSMSAPSRALSQVSLARAM